MKEYRSFARYWYSLDSSFPWLIEKIRSYTFPRILKYIQHRACIDESADWERPSRAKQVKGVSALRESVSAGMDSTSLPDLDLSSRSHLSQLTRSKRHGLQPPRHWFLCIFYSLSRVWKLSSVSKTLTRTGTGKVGVATRKLLGRVLPGLSCVTSTRPTAHTTWVTSRFPSI